jgi:hypothetical protein
MTDRSFVLRWAHLGLRGDARGREIVETNRAALQAHVAEIQAEQEQRNAALRRIDRSHIPPLRIADRYTAGRHRALRRANPTVD